LQVKNAVTAIDIERMTVKEVARQLGCNPETVKAHIRQLFPGLMQNGKATLLDDKQATIILEKMKQGAAFAHHVTGGDVGAYNSGIAGVNLQNQIVPSESTPKAGGRLFSVRDLAERFGCDIHTIINHANRLFPGKIRNGVKTLFDERETTLILESIKRGQENQTTLKGSLQGTETALTPALKLAELTELIKKSYEQIDEIKTAEIARLKQDREALQIRLSEAEQWYSVKRVLIETGKEYPWKPFKEYSVRNGYGVEKSFDKNYGEVNAYHRDVWNAVYGVEL
jgi:DNA-binding CsgD family transcriptional regulator